MEVPKLNNICKMRVKRGGWSMSWSLTRAGILVLVLISILIESDGAESCVCSGGLPCERNFTSSDCPNGRVISRRDCTCCFVCAKQLTEECNEKDLLCDSDYGLECGPDHKCSATTKCEDDTACSNDRFCVAGACSDPCKVLPSVCADEGLKNGICLVRNHRAVCSCPLGQSVNSDKVCVPTPEEALSKECEKDGRVVKIGQKIYTDNCGNVCECEGNGKFACKGLEGKEPPCNSGFIPITKLSGEMSSACKILLGSDVFDGCCVPDKCLNVTSQDESKGSRDFKLTESQNNLGDGEEKGGKHKTAAESNVNINGNEMMRISMINEGAHKDGGAGGFEITVSEATAHSAVIDLPMYEKEGRLAIALTSDLRENPKDEKLWKIHDVPAFLSEISIGDLEPNKEYTLKFSTDDEESQLVQFKTIAGDESSSSMKGENEEATTFVPPMDKEPIKEVSSSTPPTGCSHNGSSVEFGHVTLQGCDERCECMKNGQMKCTERCSIPYFKKGSFAHDPLCFEEPSGTDDCCVIVACSRSSNVEARELTIRPCDTVKCGPNADCRSEVSPAGLEVETDEHQETLCVCKEGFIGDPYNEIQGCKQAVTPSAASSSSPSPVSSEGSLDSMAKMEKPRGCVFKNKSYEFGEEHYDGCSYKCHCENSGEFLCRPRCNYRRDDEDMEIPEGCKIKKDPLDPECCETLSCHGDSVEMAGGSRKDKPSVLHSDGCLYKNKTYAKDEKFHEGCEQECMCFSNGDVTCKPRCPPAAAGPNGTEKCVTLKDPADNCCTVFVCVNNATDLLNTTADLSDVMKTFDNSTGHQHHPNRFQLVQGKSHESRSEEFVSSEELGGGAQEFTIRLSVSPLNESALLVSLKVPKKELSKIEKENVIIQYSKDFVRWQEIKVKGKEMVIDDYDDELHTVIGGLLPIKEYYVRAKIKNSESNTVSAFTKNRPKSKTPNPNHGGEEESHESMSSGEEPSSSMTSSSSEDALCKYKERMFSSDEEFYDGCDNYCACVSGKISCFPIECPTEGLEIVDANCVKWEVDDSVVREPPNCCPEMKCVQNSSCELPGGFHIPNYEQVPRKLSGCDKKCFCEYGNLTCQDSPPCPTIPDKPPPNLPCPAEMAVKIHIDYDECCMTWTCKNSEEYNISVLDGSQNRFPHINSSFFHDLNLTSSIENDDIQDQFVPPSTGNEPSYLGLNKIHPQQLQELLHQLSSIGEVHPNGHPFIQGTYTTVRNPKEVEELERNGAKIIEQTDDGSFVLFVPSPPSGPGHSGHPPFPHHGLGHFPYGHLPPHQVGSDELSNVIIRPLNESTLQIDFTISHLLVGLHGVVEVYYTKEFKTKPNPDQWERQVYQQAEDILDNSHLQLFLTGLTPDSDYHIQIQVLIRDLQNAPVSAIHMVHTPPPAIPTTTLPPEIMIDPETKLVDVTSTGVKVTWRKFNPLESSLIDGVQMKYKAINDHVYATTSLIHRSINTYELSNLQPGTEYEVDLLFIPFQNQSTELRSEKPLHINTLPNEDPYAFNIVLTSGKVSEQSAEFTFEGVPHPEDKYVNIYQIFYQNDQQKEQKSAFKVAKWDTSKKASITDLKPGTKYNVWLEAFLTNGKKKRTNVIEIVTKAGQISTTSNENDILNSPRSQEQVPEANSYYGALVALSIVAALSIIGIIILLMILIKKQNQAKAPINDRKSESSYDNPSFKNYDLESNGHTKPGEP